MVRTLGLLVFLALPGMLQAQTFRDQCDAEALEAITDNTAAQSHEQICRDKIALIEGQLDFANQFPELWFLTSQWEDDLADLKQQFDDGIEMYDDPDFGYLEEESNANQFYIQTLTTSQGNGNHPHWNICLGLYQSCHTTAEVWRHELYYHNPPADPVGIQVDLTNLANTIQAEIDNYD